MPIKTATLASHATRIARAMAHLAAHPDRTPSLEELADIAVPRGTPLDPGLEVVELPALRCARLRYQGPYAELEAVYDRLYGEWLPQSGEEPGSFPVFEEYLNDCRTLPPAEWLTDILLPLKPPLARG